jgi:hypothetical protein
VLNELRSAEVQRLGHTGTVSEIVGSAGRSATTHLSVAADRINEQLGRYAESTRGDVKSRICSRNARVRKSSALM